MDTSKWKSVLLPKDVYQEIVVISHVEGRTISGQLRIVFAVCGTLGFYLLFHSL